jgi:hypothetical protein
MMGDYDKDGDDQTLKAIVAFWPLSAAGGTRCQHW